MPTSLAKSYRGNKINQIIHDKQANIITRTLIYGFGPYGCYKSNITANIINRLIRLNLGKCVVFKTHFNAAMFNEALQATKPDLIIGIGQHPRARKIRIERRALNSYKNEKGEKKIIINKSPIYRYVNLKLSACDDSTLTYDAGDYVCNYSMYIMCEYCATKNSKFAFLHIPLNANEQNMVNYIKNIIIQSSATIQPSR